MSAIFSIILAIAMAITGAAPGTPAAASMTLHDVVLTVADQEYKLDPSASVGVYTDDESVILDAHVQAGDLNLFPSQIKLTEKELSLIVGMTGYSVNFEQLGLTELLDSLDIQAILTSALANYGVDADVEALINSAANMEVSEEASANFQQVFAERLAFGDPIEAEFQSMGETINGFAVEAVLSLQDVGAIVDAAAAMGGEIAVQEILKAINGDSTEPFDSVEAWAAATDAEGMFQVPVQMCFDAEGNMRAVKIDITAAGVSLLPVAVEMDAAGHIVANASLAQDGSELQMNFSSLDEGMSFNISVTGDTNMNLTVATTPDVPLCITADVSNAATSAAGTLVLTPAANGGVDLAVAGVADDNGISFVLTFGPDEIVDHSADVEITAFESIEQISESLSSLGQNLLMGAMGDLPALLQDPSVMAITGLLAELYNAA